MGDPPSQSIKHFLNATSGISFEIVFDLSKTGVLVAISIPIFTSQLEKSRDAVTLSNARAAYAEASAAYLTGEGENNVTVTKGTGTDTTVKYVKVADVVVKGQADGKSGTTFGSGELPFTLGEGVSAALEKADADGKIDLYFAWDTNGTCTATLSAPTTT